MLKTLTITEQYALVFGMQWLIVDPLENRHEKIAELRQAGAQIAARFKRSGEENIGTTDAITPTAKNVTALSGAAQLATMPEYEGRTVLALVEAKGNAGNPGVVAVVGLINGNVSIDKLLSPAQVKGEIARFNELCERARQNYVLVGHILTPGLATVSAPLIWSDLLPKRLSRFKSTKAVPIKPLRSDRGSQVAAIAVVSVLAVLVAFTAWGKYDAYRKHKQAMEQARKVNPQVLYARSVQQFMEQPKPLLRDAITAIRSRIGKIDSEFAGWRLSSVICLPDSCSMQWERVNGTFAEFSQRAPKDWTALSFSDDGQRITNQIALAIPTHALPERDKWISMDAFKQSDVSTWQRYSDVAFQFSLSPLNLEAVPAGISPQVLENSPSAIRSSQWQTRGDWYMTDGFASSPNYVTFDNLKMTISTSSITFEATGKVYVKS